MKINNIFYYLLLFLCILFFVFSCLTINNRKISEYRKVVCPTCGYENAVFINDDDKDEIIEIECANCKRRILVNIK